MPSVSLFYGPERKLEDKAFQAFATDLAEVIKDRLAAKPEVIQILPVQLAHTAFGPPVYIEIKARDVPHRDEAVLNGFLREVDEMTFKLFGCRCRIRYFRYPGSFLAAIN